ncbi:MAG TPA: hypothetical protein VFL14_01255, partial [Xanthomonadales bacterium]|nr:hypothetical protein [Xanthomonadales bacterium]
GTRIRVFGAAVDEVVAASEPGASFDEVRSSDSSGPPLLLIVAVAIVIVAAGVVAFVVTSN